MENWRSRWTRLWLVTLLGLPGLAQEQPPPRNAEERHAAAERQKLERISAVVRGRCIDAATGEPLAGCVIELHCWGGRKPDLPPELLEPQAVTTGDDGTFAARVLARLVAARVRVGRGCA